MKRPDRFSVDWWRLLLFAMSAAVSCAAMMIAFARGDPWQLQVVVGVVYTAMVTLAWNEMRKWL